MQLTPSFEWQCTLLICFIQITFMQSESYVVDILLHTPEGHHLGH